jgi:pentafunctional AROM polypeptide
MTINKKHMRSKVKNIVLLSRIGKMHELRATVPNEGSKKLLAEGVTVVSGIPVQYVNPTLSQQLRELPGAAEKAYLFLQILPNLC